MNLSWHKKNIKFIRVFTPRGLITLYVFLSVLISRQINLENYTLFISLAMNIVIASSIILFCSIFLRKLYKYSVGIDGIILAITTSYLVLISFQNFNFNRYVLVDNHELFVPLMLAILIFYMLIKTIVKTVILLYGSRTKNGS